MNKLIVVEAILLVIISFLTVSYFATGSWEAQAPSQLSSFNTTFWNLDQDYPALNTQLVFVSNSTLGNTTINQFDIWFNSNYYGNETVRIHASLFVPNATLPYGGCTLVNCTCINGSDCTCVLYCNSSQAPHDMPAILLLHGTGGKASDMLNYSMIFAEKGYVIMAMDSPGCGNSTGPECNGTYFVDFSDGPYSSYYYHNVIAASRALTVMADLPFVNTSAMGVSGASMGGLTTFLLSAVDGRVIASVPIVAAGYLDESQMRGSFINFIMPAQTSTNDAKVKEFVSYFDPRGYVANLTSPTLMLIGTHDEFFFLDSVNKTYAILAEPKGLDLAPNQGHSFTAGWVDSASIWFDHYLRGANATLPVAPNATVASAYLSSALSMSLSPSSMANYTPVLYYRYTLPGSLWTELNASGAQMVPLLPLTSNVEYYTGVKSNGSLISTSSVSAVPATSSLFWIIVAFLALLLIILASNWREEISAYAASDMRGTILFVISVGLWLVAAFSMAVPWLSIPGKASLSLLQFWDAYAIHLPAFWIVLIALLIALFAYLARMWIGGIALAAIAVYLYFLLAYVHVAGVEFAMGIYIFGICAAVSLLIPALVKIMRD
jgi:cephalosporin-C deacetylase-like acetyl esterase